MTKTKACKICGIVKSLIEFEVHNECKDGYSNRCKVCKRVSSNKSSQKNREQRRLRAKEKYPDRYIKDLEKISGNWELYFKGLLRKRERALLSVDLLLSLLKEQNFKCALTGIELTCAREFGNATITNASIDRIEAGGPYIKENVRLVCVAINKFRLNKTDEELVFWCRKVVEYADNA